MRSVPMAAFKDNVARYIAEASSGEEIVVTRHGKPMARLVPPPEDDRAARLALVEDIRAMRAELLKKNGPISDQEIADWMAEARREWDEEL